MLCGLTIRLVDVLTTTIAFAQTVESAVGRPAVRLGPAVQGAIGCRHLLSHRRSLTLTLVPRMHQRTMNAVSEVATKAVKAVEDYRARYVGAADNSGNDRL